MLIVILSPMTGCSTTNVNRHLTIVCSIFPQYDWVRIILGEQQEEIELTLLLNSRNDLHNYQPTVEAIANISMCDLFIYIGGESDRWVEDVLRDASNKNMKVIKLLDILGDMKKQEEYIEGIQLEEEEEDEDSFDEHVWLSLRNAKIFCQEITSMIVSLDNSNREIYESNLERYLVQLSNLDKEYMKAVEAAPQNTLLFGDRFPFRYLTEDYNLDYYAAFLGCSADTEASFDTIVFLAQKLDELNLKNIMVTESSDKKIAETIINNTKTKNKTILVLNAMQSITSTDVLGGDTYLTFMQENLEVLKKALE